MHWKNIHTHALFVGLAGFLTSLASGGLTLSLMPAFFLRHDWLLLVLSFLILLYVLKQISRKSDELSLFLFSIGGFFLLIGGFVGILVVILGIIVALYALHHYQHATLHAPDVPDVRKINK